MRGQKLHAIWKDLSPAAQESIVTELAGALEVLHVLTDTAECDHPLPGAQPFAS